MLYSYFNFLKKKDVTYTIDMLRLTARISFDEWEKICFYINTVLKDYIYKYYISNDIKSFKYNYNIKINEDSSFWIGFKHNAEKGEKIDNKMFYLYNKSKLIDYHLYNITIEFNPNKVDLVFLNKILDISRNWIIKSCDFAVDIPLNILDFYCIDKNHKREIKVFSKGYDDKTIYIGKSNNRIKIYNKKKESNLDVNNLTRLEVSSELDLSINDILTFNYSFEFPVLFVNEYIYSFSDFDKKNDIMRCILFALQNGYDINDLSRRYKEKVKQLINGNFKIIIDNKFCSNVLRKCILHIFPYIN